jgi:F-type H+-transporting ATPase subunit b
MAIEAHGAETGAPSAVGMPQLDFTSYGNQIFWLVVALAAIYLIVTRIAMPRISAVLADRKGTMTNDLAAAEDFKARAEAAEAAYAKALADARTEAQRIAAEARAAIQKDLDAAIARADAEIAARASESERRIGEIRASAIDAVREVARDTAEEVVRVLGGRADARAVSDAVDNRLEG